MTDTAQYADIVLPATTFLEHQDLRTGYGAFTLQSVKPVIDPVGEARSNNEVFVSHDGMNVYAVMKNSESIVVFDRNASTTDLGSI